MKLGASVLYKLSEQLEGIFHLLPQHTATLGWILYSIVLPWTHLAICLPEHSRSMNRSMGPLLPRKWCHDSQPCFPVSGSCSQTKGTVCSLSGVRLHSHVTLNVEYWSSTYKLNVIICIHSQERKCQHCPSFRCLLEPWAHFPHMGAVVLHFWALLCIAWQFFTLFLGCTTQWSIHFTWQLYR